MNELAVMREDGLVSAFAAALSVSDPDAAIKLAVGELLREGMCHSVPVELSRLCRILGVVKIIEREMVLEGALHKNRKGSFNIWIRSGRSPKRQRFTIAHEIGHLLFRRYVPELKNMQDEIGGDTSSEEERLCNLAAAEILMPESFVAPLIAQYLTSPLDMVVAVANSCNVSLEAALAQSARYWPRNGVLELWKYRDGWSLASSRFCGWTSEWKILREVGRYREAILTGIWNGHSWSTLSSLPWMYLKLKEGICRLKTMPLKVSGGHNYPIVLVYHAIPKSFDEMLALRGARNMVMPIGLGVTSIR